MFLRCLSYLEVDYKPLLHTTHRRLGPRGDGRSGRLPWAPNLRGTPKYYDVVLQLCLDILTLVIRIISQPKSKFLKRITEFFFGDFSFFGLNLYNGVIRGPFFHWPRAPQKLSASLGQHPVLHEAKRGKLCRTYFSNYAFGFYEFLKYDNCFPRMHIVLRYLHPSTDETTPGTRVRMRKCVMLGALAVKSCTRSIYFWGLYRSSFEPFRLVNHLFS